MQLERRDLPAVVLSDLHLAHPASRLDHPAALRPLLEGARTAVFNGDSSEWLALQHRRRSLDLVARLAETAANAGARPIFVTGNHDPAVSTCHHVDLLDGRVLLTHGDALHPQVAPWSRDAAYIGAERERRQGGQPEPNDFDAWLRLSKQSALLAALYLEQDGPWAKVGIVAKFASAPLRAVRAFHYWSQVPRLADALCRRWRPEAELIAIGHSHRRGVWELGGRVLVNTGSWQPLSAPYRLWVDEQGAQICGVRRHRGEYRPAAARTIRRWT